MDWKTKEGLKRAVSRALDECSSSCLDNDEEIKAVRDTVVMYVETFLDKLPRVP